ncbi:hypothetical protein [Burkholderia thailandensis]|uniref:hypothetical protein n=1 Tax=Burkholderia thailandensis TaxID=57975 RepID=UPI001EE22091|nr:hypothetical protein [Burkholderia thailandensis]
MHSSISRCASFRWRGRICSILPLRVADDVRLGRVEIDRATLLPGGEERLVDAVQVLQVRHQLGAARGLRPLRVREHRGHFGILT